MFRAILHVDMDAFYASVEQRDDPSLAGKPLIVGGTSGRGVVAAASYEVRRYGVRSAMPMREALRRCPHAICVRPRMSRYKEVSEQVFAVFREFTPQVEGLSLDEAFLDVTGSLGLFGDAVSIARAIKQRIRERTGLAASVGVAPNKLVAKIASDLDKPDGLTVVTTERINAVLDPLPIRRLWGIGPKTAEQLERQGIATLGQLRVAPDAQLKPVFGRWSDRMRARASGIDDRDVVADVADQQVSAEETFDADLVSTKSMQAELARLADRTASRLREQRLVARVVSVKIRRHDFSTYSRQHRFSPATQDTRQIERLAQELLADWLAEYPDARIRLLGVGVSGLEPAEQLDLFAATAAAPGRLDAAIDQIRERFGRAAIVRGPAAARDATTTPDGVRPGLPVDPGRKPGRGD